MNLFQTNPDGFTLNSGVKSLWKIECDVLGASDISTLALMISQIVGPFHSVEGVPRGGLQLAGALEKHCYRGESFAPLPHLIVDDVLTTGSSMERLRSKIGVAAQGAKIIGAVVFARGRCPEWVTPLFQMPEALWIK